MSIESLRWSIQNLVQVIEINYVVERVHNHFALVNNNRAVSFRGAAGVTERLLVIAIVYSALIHLILSRTSPTVVMVTLLNLSGEFANVKETNAI